MSTHLMANKPFDHQHDSASPVTRLPRVVCLPGLLPGIFTLSKKSGKTYLGSGFALRCFQRFSFLDVATQLWRWPPTGSLAVQPSRSSRTEDDFPLFSCAHDG